MTSQAAGSLLHRRRPLKKVTAISADMQTKLRSKGVDDASQVLALSQSELCHLLGASALDAVELVQQVCRQVVPRPRLAADLYAAKPSSSSPSTTARCVATGVDAIDALLCGGLQPGCITEILGATGAGKTELCYSIAARCLLPDDGNSVVFVAAEGGDFSALRLLSLVQQLRAGDWAPAQCERACANVSVHRVGGVEQLLELLNSLEDALIERNTALICIDAIDAIVLRDFSAAVSTRRTAVLLDIAATLKYLSETLAIPVLCTNHLSAAGSAAVKISSRLGDERPADSTASTTVALGVVWGHAVNTRLVLQETPEHAVRRLTIAKCPYAPVASVHVQLTDAGITTADHQPDSEQHIDNYWETIRHSFG